MRRRRNRIDDLRNSPVCVRPTRELQAALNALPRGGNRRVASEAHVNHVVVGRIARGETRGAAFRDHIDGVAAIVGVPPGEGRSYVMWDESDFPPVTHSVSG
jgi:hypothetical protein